MIEPARRMLCVEVRKPLRGGRTRPFLAIGVEEDGEQTEIVLKLRRPASNDGHYEGTSLACELIVAMIARASGLPVPDYAVVEVTPDLVRAQPRGETRDLLERNIGSNFGSAYREAYGLWDGTGTASNSLRDQLEDTLAFDATVMNGDRKREKPNLLVRGENLLLIDHSLALPVFLWGADVVDPPSALYPEENVRAHCTFDAVRDQGRAFGRVHSSWGNGITTADLGRIREAIPSTWERRPGDLDKVFNFLSGRPGAFPNIAADLVRIVR